MTSKCILSEILAKVSLRKFNSDGFGIIIKDIPDFSYRTYLKKVINELQALKKISCFFIGFNEVELSKLKDEVDILSNRVSIFFKVEEAEASRNNGDENEVRIIIVRRDTPKISSLQWFRTISINELYTEICSDALDKFANTNSAINNLWKALKTNDLKRIVALERLVDYYSALKNSDSQDLPDNTINEMYRLGLCRDKNIFLINNYLAVKKALINNYNTVLRIGEFDKADRKAIQTNLVEYSSQVVSQILEYYTTRNIKILSNLELEEVEGCFKAIVKSKLKRKDSNNLPTGKTGKKNLKSKIQNVNSLGVSLAIDKDEAKIKEILEDIEKQISNVDVGKTNKIEISNDEEIITIMYEPSICNLIGAFVDKRIFGGIVRAEAKNPIDILEDIHKNNYETYGETFYKSLLHLITRFDLHLNDNTKLLDTFNLYIRKREDLVKSAHRLADCPIIKISENASFTFECIEYIDCFESLLRILNDNYGKMMDLSTQATKEVISCILAIDMVYIIGNESLHAIPTPLNPLYLWKYIELTRELSETSSALEELDREFLVRKSNEIPDPVSAVLISSIVTKGDYAIIPISGKIGNVPFYSSQQQIDKQNDGMTDIGNNIKKYIELFPHCQFGLRLAIINPPSVSSAISLVNGLLKNKDFELKGLDLNIYRTKEADIGWGTFNDDDLDDNIFNRFELSESTNFKVQVFNQKYEVRDLVKQLNKNFHCVIFIDPNEKSVKRVKNNNLLKIHPLCIPKVFEYDRFYDTVNIIPASEGSVFTDYSKLVERLNDKPQTYHSSIWVESPVKKEDYLEILSVTDWLLIADQNLKNLEFEVATNSEKVYYKTSMYRDIGIYSRNNLKFIQGFNKVVRDIGNYAPSSSGLKKVLKNIQLLNERGIVSLVSKDTTKIFNSDHAKGALGIAIAAEWYRSINGHAILASLDTELARSWLEEREEGYIPDLIGILINNDKISIDIIEVKTHSNDFHINYDRDEIDGKAVEQVCAVYKIINEIFNERSRITTTSRREVLRLQVYQAFYQLDIPNDIKYEWTIRLNKLFAGELECIINKNIYFVDFNSTGDVEIKHFTQQDDINFMHIKNSYITNVLEDRFERLGNNYNEDSTNLVTDTGSNIVYNEAAVTSSIDIERNSYRIEDNINNKGDISFIGSRNSNEKENKSNDFKSTIDKDSLSNDIEEKAKLLYKALQDYRIETKPIEIDNVQIASRFIRFRIQLRAGETWQKIAKYKEDISREIEAEAEILVGNERGSKFVYIDVPRKSTKSIMLLEKLDLLPKKASVGHLNIIVGQKPDGSFVIEDLAKAPHLLTSGSTGSGKTIFLYSLLISLLHQYSENEIELVVIDPKRTDFIFFEGLPHLRNKEVIFDPEQALLSMKELVERDLEERTSLLRSNRSRDLFSYNEKNTNAPLKPILVLIDEYADLIQAADMQGNKKEFEHRMIRLAQRARNVGIHLVIATQRPSADIVTSNLKTNIPFRISFRLPAHQDSMTILDCPGAEDLLGKGDMLLSSSGDISRLQALYISEKDLESFIDNLI